VAAEDDFSSDEGAGGGEEWRAASGAWDAFRAAALAEGARATTLSPALYGARRALLAERSAALARVWGSPGPSAALSRTLARGLREAVLQYRMLREGDRVLVGLSGGKDSMTLLLQLLRLQAAAPIWFEVAAATVDPQYEGFDPAPLASWCAALRVPHFFERAPVMAIAAEHMTRDSICSFCARLKRGLLYTAARREGYNVLALGQHLDDLAESFVMSAFRNGILRTQKAHYLNDAGDVRIIRPLALLRERDTRAFAHACDLPIIPENCPACFSGPTVRYKVKRLLAREEAENKGLFAALGQAMRPLMTSQGHTACLRAAGTLVQDDTLLAAPKGWQPARLPNPADPEPVGGGRGKEQSGGASDSEEAGLPLGGDVEDDF
jgi:tRNA 2-thiocytidine biosynthesis protein TtcA